MSMTQERISDAPSIVKAGVIDMNLEVVVIPVSDADRAKDFYTTLGWRLDVDRTLDPGFRLIQFTPPGSGCSVQFGSGLTSAAPGSARGLHLIVSDIETARADLVSRGIRVTETFHCETGFVCRFRDGDGVYRRASGPAPERLSYGSFALFDDPDGNGWMLQEVTTRFPGRVDPAVTTFASAGDLASALRRAAAALGDHTPGIDDDDWSNHYADYVMRERTGVELTS